MCGGVSRRNDRELRRLGDNREVGFVVWFGWERWWLARIYHGFLLVGARRRRRYSFGICSMVRFVTVEIVVVVREVERGWLTVFHLDSEPRLLVISLVAQYRPVFLLASFLVLVGRTFLCFFLRSRGIEIGWGFGTDPCNILITPSRQVMNRPEVAS